MKKSIFLGAMALTGMLHASTNCNWPSVNINLQNSRYNPCETTLNKNNVGQLILVNSFDLPNGVQVAPIVVDGKVYFGDLGGTFYACDFNDLNNVIWSTNVGASVTTPCTVANGKVYFATGDLNLHALDISTGSEVAGFPVAIDPTIISLGGGGVLAGPVVVENIVIIPTCDGAPFGTNIHPVLHNAINAFNATTGQFKWRRVVQPAPYGSHGGSFSTASCDTNLKMMYIGTTNSDDKPVSKFSNALLALDYRTGDLKWSSQFVQDDSWGPLYPNDPDWDIGASPNLFSINKNGSHGKKTDVVGVAAKQGIYRVFDRASGRLIWETNILESGYVPASTTAPGAAYDATTNTLYVPMLQVIDNNRPYNAINILSLNGNPDAGQEIGQATFGLFQFVVVALDANTGSFKWRSKMTGVGSGSITAANGVVYMDNWNGEIRALNGATGATLYSNTTTFAPPTFLGGPITVTGGKMFVPVGIFPGGPGGVKVFGLP